MKKNNIKRLLLFCCIIASTTILHGCDSGDIYPEEKKDTGLDIDVTASFKFSNLETFPTSYKLIFGSFNDASPYPISSKVITKPTSGDEVSVSLNNIPEEATYLALYLIQEYSGTQIYPFYKYPIGGELKEDVVIPTQNIDLAVLGRIQHQVFSQCLQCHGGSGFAAAGLYLTEGHSYSYLVNVTAKNNADKKRVTPNSTQNSFLIDILKAEALKNQHSSLSSLKDDDVVLVEKWIENGAKE